MTLRIAPPGSKSMTQRALVIAALADRPSEIQGALDCDDSRYLSTILNQLGVTVRPNWNTGLIEVTPRIANDWPLLSDGQPLFCGNAGTAMRFCCALSLLCQTTIYLDGDTRMRQRPIGPMGDALTALGVNVNYVDQEGFPPLKLTRGEQIAPQVSVDTSKSSQFASGLLLVAPLLPQGLRVQLSGGHLVSLPYLKMTTDMMRRIGGQVRWLDEHHIAVQPRAYQFNGDHALQTVEVDWSAAAFVLAAAKIAHCTIEIPRLLPPRRSLQGDAGFATMLKELESPRPHQFDLTDMPDLIAPLAAAALFASHPSEICGAAHTRIKESDRIAVLCRELGKVGAKIIEHPDGMDIQPLDLACAKAASLNPENDHRMAMAFGLLSLRVPAIEVINPECVSKSYPKFWQDLERIKQESRCLP